MKKLFKKFIAIGLLSCTMLTAAVLPSYAANRAYTFNCDPVKEDAYGTQFGAGATIHATGQVFTKSSAYGYVITNTHSISTQDTYLIAYILVTYDDSTRVSKRAVSDCGVMQTHTKYVVNMNGNNFIFDQSKVLSLYRTTVRATNSKSDAVPAAISSNYSWSENLTLQQIFDSWGS